MCTIDETNFRQEVIESTMPVLVDFWAPWCAPCRFVAPILEEIANEFEGKLKVCKLNVDENPNIASQYDIRAIPTMIVFKNGEPATKIIGAVPKPTLIEKLKKVLE